VAAEVGDGRMPSMIDNTPNRLIKKIISVFAKCPLTAGAAKDHLTFCRRFRQRIEQVLASRRPAKELLQIKHFLAAILLAPY
jgi:hypothetical protein